MHIFDFFEKEPIFGIFPNFITSKNDKDRHYIDQSKLMKLYHINRNWNIKVIKSELQLLGLDETTLIGIQPRFHGDYPTYLYAGLIDRMPKDLKDKMSNDDNPNQWKYCTVHLTDFLH